MALQPLKSTSIQSLIEHIESSPFIDGYYSAKRFKGLLVTKEGLDIIKGVNGKNEAFFNDLLIGSYRRMQAIWKMYDDELMTGVPNYSLGNDKLSPQINLGQKLVSSDGSQGSVWRFSNLDNFVFKFYHNDAEFEENGFLQFKGLLNPDKNTVFKTPTPYFATPHTCAMSSFPSEKDFWNFLNNNPSEEKQLSAYLLDLASTDSLNCDLGDILSHYGDGGLETFVEDSLGTGSVFILDFDPSKKESSERYTLGTVDLSSLDIDYE